MPGSHTDIPMIELLEAWDGPAGILRRVEPPTEFASALAFTPSGAHDAGHPSPAPTPRWEFAYANPQLAAHTQANVVDHVGAHTSASIIRPWQAEMWVFEAKPLRQGRWIVITTSDLVQLASQPFASANAGAGPGARNGMAGARGGSHESVSSLSSPSSTVRGSSSPPSPYTPRKPSLRRQVSSDSSPHLLLPTTAVPNPFPNQQLPVLPSQAILEFNDQFVSHPWHRTPLGPMATWPPVLRQAVQHMMACPYNTILAWGPEHTMLYNQSTSKALGAMHPALMGAPYAPAWKDIGMRMDAPLSTGMKGIVTLIDKEELYLKLGGELPQETYATYATIPIRDPITNTVQGLDIPCFINTAEVVTQRRLTALHEISTQIATAHTPEEVCERAISAMRTNPRDVGFALLYTVCQPEAALGADKDLATDDSSIYSGDTSGKPTTESADDAVTGFKLMGSFGVKQHAFIPSTFHSGEPSALEEANVAPLPQGCIVKYMRRAHIERRSFVLDIGASCPNLPDCLEPNMYGDIARQGVVLPIRMASDDKTHGMLVIGLSTRLPYDQAYADFVSLLRGFCVKGLTTVKLHVEEMQRTRYLAALNRRKNEELNALLEQRTRDLRKAELKLSTAVGDMQIGFFMANLEGDIEWVNDAFRQIVGLTPEESPGAWYTKVHPDDLPTMVEAWERGLTERIRVDVRYKPLPGRTLPPGMDWVWGEGRAGPIWDEDGNIITLFGTILDITERKAAELYHQQRVEEALETRRQQEYFIDMTSHELRNPLSAICLSVDEVNEGLTALAPNAGQTGMAAIVEVQKALGVITFCAMHMKCLVDDVLTLSKLESGLLVVTDVPCRPVDFTEDVLRMFKKEMQTHDILHTFQIDTSFQELNRQWFSLDPSRVKQVLINLMTNSIKFTSGCPIRQLTLTLAATRNPPHYAQEHHSEDGSARGPEDLWLTFSVQDTGKGIGQDEQARLFERFRQGNVRTHVNYGGNGLGLYICKKITQLLGGDIWVESEVDRGSTFSFCVLAKECDAPDVDMSESPEEVAPILAVPGLPALPASPDQGPPPAVPNNLAGPSQAVPAKPPPVYVLLTEDNQINQQLLRKQLVRAGCVVYVANDGIEALEFVYKCDAAIEDGPQLDCILMDIEMPRMGGIECAQNIRQAEASGQLKRHVPILAVSANTRAAQVQTMLDSGMDGAVAKPFTVKDLLKQIRGVVDRK